MQGREDCVTLLPFASPSSEVQSFLPSLPSSLPLPSSPSLWSCIKHTNGTSLGCAGCRGRVVGSDCGALLLVYPPSLPSCSCRGRVVTALFFGEARIRAVAQLRRLCHKQENGWSFPTGISSLALTLPLILPGAVI